MANVNEDKEITGMDLNTTLSGEEGGKENEGFDNEEDNMERVDENSGNSKENDPMCVNVLNKDTGVELASEATSVSTEEQVESNEGGDVALAEHNDQTVAEQNHNINTSEGEQTVHADTSGEEGETGSNSSSEGKRTDDVCVQMELSDPHTTRITPPPSYSDVVHSDSNEQRTTEFIIESDSDENPLPSLPPAESKWYTVDKTMLACKLSYFFDQAKEGSLWPYLVLFQVSSGLGTFQAGIVNGLRFIGCLLGGPLWGMIADQKRIHRPLAIVITIFAVTLQCSQPFIASYLGPADKNTCPSRSNETTEEAERRQSLGLVHNDKMFYTLLIVSIFACFFDGTTLSFVDSGVQKRIKVSKHPIDFGRQRLFGSVGYAVGSVASSAGIRYFPHANVSCYAGMFCMYFIFGVCLMISFSRLFKGTTTTGEENTSTGSPHAPVNPKVKEIIWKTLKSFHIIFFLATVLFNGLMRALVFSFTYLYLIELGAPTMLLGISMVVSQIASLTFYALVERIISLCGGTMQVMCLSCFSWVIRLLCLAFMKSYWLILPINVLNGVSASLFVAASIIHVRRTCPPVAFTTMYGIRNSLFNGGGYILANVVGGELYQLFGAKRLFLFTCLLCAVWVSIMVAYLVKYRNTYTTMVTDETSYGHCEDAKAENIEMQSTSSIHKVAPLPS